MAEASKSSKPGAAIKACSCKHAYQDRVHGQGQRVKNNTAKGDFRCTICGVVSK